MAERWRVHPERDKQGEVVEGRFRYCADPACPEGHLNYRPFYPMREL